ncbi:hypothetical protein L1987_51308 [Smallanthus sonchifolius]|uniref:Uncharacterized protein n=1 Tax=Smallanthus sonchifolius TaxID=185202 RepID=A0ACB9EQA1_9ASTR|nr:hypothetical protein L1987_51308 [Smallanthus sonchifolius]
MFKIAKNRERRRQDLGVVKFIKEDDGRVLVTRWVGWAGRGDCKHIMVIRDMRLVHPEDVQNRAAYPLIMFQSRLRFQKCSCCKIFKAVKVTVDDKWAPENPCYFYDDHDDEEDEVIENDGGLLNFVKPKVFFVWLFASLVVGQLASSFFHHVIG